MRQAGRAREWERIWLFEWVYCSERRREREGERERLGVKQKRRDGERGSEKDTKWMFPLYKCKGRRKKMWREESKGDSHSQSIWKKKNRLIAVTSLIATFLSANRTVTVKPKPSGLHDQDRIVGCCFFNSSHCAAVVHLDRQDYKQVLHGVFPSTQNPGGDSLQLSPPYLQTYLIVVATVPQQQPSFLCDKSFADMDVSRLRKPSSSSQSATVPHL